MARHTRVTFERIPSSVGERAVATVTQGFGVIHSRMSTIQRAIGCPIVSLYQRRAMHESQVPQQPPHSHAALPTALCGSKAADRIVDVRVVEGASVNGHGRRDWLRGFDVKWMQCIGCNRGLYFSVLKGWMAALSVSHN